MDSKKILISLLFCSLSFLGQAQSKAFKATLNTILKGSVPFITCEELKKQPNALLLDCRPANEYQVSHLQNAVRIGYDDFSLKKVKSIAKNTPIVVYCSIGARSEQIGEKLIAEGYTHVQNLYGSIFEWVNQGNPVYDATGKVTQKVHAYSPIWGVWLEKGEKVY